MIDHFNLPVRDLARSGKFYRALLEPMGFDVIHEDDEVIGFGAGSWGFGLALAETPSDPIHIAFKAQSHTAVDDFHARGLAEGATSNGTPGLRPEYGATYYACFVIDPDGNNVEAVCRD